MELPVANKKNKEAISIWRWIDLKIEMLRENTLCIIQVFFFHLFLLVGGYLLYTMVVVFVIHWHESALDIHVFPIPIPPPTSLSTRSLWVFPVHQAWALVSCIQPGLVICFTTDNIHDLGALYQEPEAENSVYIFYCFTDVWCGQPWCYFHSSFFKKNDIKKIRRVV